MSWTPNVHDTSLATALKIAGTTALISLAIVGTTALLLLTGCANNPPALKSPWISPASFAGHPPNETPTPTPTKALTVYARASQPTNLTRPRPDWLVRALVQTCETETPEYCRYPMVAHCHGDTPATIFCHAHPGGEYQHSHKNDGEFAKLAVLR